MITTRLMCLDEIDRLAELDRSERVVEAYVQHGASLALEEVDWNVPNWHRDGRSDHSIQAKISSWGRDLEDNGIMWGAFDSDRLVGIAIYRPDLAPGVAQLAVLHVSNGHRGRGIATLLVRHVVAKAESDAARWLYVSATPTRNTVDFYMGRGFRPTATPHPELLREEPEDIHMIMDLAHQDRGATTSRGPEWRQTGIEGSTV